MKDKKRIRSLFREEVLKRDKYRCKVCGDSTSKLDAHHITDRHEMPNGGYVLSNGITLCDKENGCHWKAEEYNRTNGKNWVDGLHPLDLYTLIGSNLGKAKSDSLNL